MAKFEDLANIAITRNHLAMLSGNPGIVGVNIKRAVNNTIAELDKLFVSQVLKNEEEKPEVVAFAKKPEPKKKTAKKASKKVEANNIPASLGIPKPAGVPEKPKGVFRRVDPNNEK